MKTMERLLMATLLAVGVSLFAKSTAQGEDWGTIQFTKVGDESRASGTATLSRVSYYLGFVRALV